MTATGEPPEGAPDRAGAGSSGSPAVVTIAALYGAGGDVIGSQVADRLRVPFFDRAIPEEAAQRSGLPERAIVKVDEGPRTLRQHLFARAGRVSTITGGHMDRLDIDQRDLRAHVEAILARASATGGVVLGRGGMVVLRAVPWALHVHLSGPPDARIAQAMAAAGLDRRVAERQQRREDRARIDYVRAAYGVDGRDADLYHLMLDSTSLDVDACVEIIVAASLARSRNPRATAPI